MASLAVSIAKNEFIVGGKYRLMRKIGSGSFGDIYLGINISNGEVRKRDISLKHRPTAGLPARLPLFRVSRSSSRLIFCRRYPSGNYRPSRRRRSRLDETKPTVDETRRDGDPSTRCRDRRTSWTTFFLSKSRFVIREIARACVRVVNKR